MAEFEGWDPSGQKFNTGEKPSVAYRNHNPGNLRSSIFEMGKRDGFAFFLSDFVGYFALQYDIMQKCRGKTITRLNGESTLHDLVRVYSGENLEVVENYVSHIEKRTGFSRTTKLETFITE